MIEFACKCGHLFRVEDEEAGGLTQCPQCGLLRDVPRPDELARLAHDGTYLVHGGSGPENEDPDDVAELAYIYQRGARDALGNEIDLRNTQADIDAVGGTPIPISPDLIPREQAPKYDPESGELIEPIELKPDGREYVNPATIPMATATINYASAAMNRPVSFIGALLRLLSPVNLAVLFAVLCMHAMLWPLIFVGLAGVFLLVIAIPVMGALILAHYGNVVQDVGVFEKDEMPRPLRDLGFYDDLWLPFCDVFGSLLICYGPCLLLPAILVRVPGLQSASVGLMVILAGLGTFFLPAVMLTLICGGTILNLRPDRVLAVIHACGFGYFLAVVLWVAAAIMYLWGWAGTSTALDAILHPSNLPQWLTSWNFALPALVIGIYLMHAFCQWLGLLYRAHFDRFPWVLQRHVSTKHVAQSPGQLTSPQGTVRRESAVTVQRP